MGGGSPPRGCNRRERVLWQPAAARGYGGKGRNRRWHGLARPTGSGARLLRATRRRQGSLGFTPSRCRCHEGVRGDGSTLPEKAILSDILESHGVQDWLNKAVNVGDPDACLFPALKFQGRTNVQKEIFGELLPYPSILHLLGCLRSNQRYVACISDVNEMPVTCHLLASNSPVATFISDLKTERASLVLSNLSTITVHALGKETFASGGDFDRVKKI